jgi:hypothetical protein
MPTILRPGAHYLHIALTQQGAHGMQTVDLLGLGHLDYSFTQIREGAKKLLSQENFDKQPTRHSGEGRNDVSTETSLVLGDSAPLRETGIT